MDSKNPYMAPAEPLVQQAGEFEFVREAPKGARFLTLLVDSVLIRIVMAGAAVPLGAMMNTSSRTGGAVALVWALAIGPIYYIALEATTGRTVGKLFVGTKVVRADGGTPTLSQIIGRTLCRYIPFEPFSFIGSNSGWHDRLSGTRVIVARGTSKGLD
jgi:uncharacterized RDD family membrane protein YckC